MYYHFINNIVYKEAPLYCIEVFKKTWNYNECGFFKEGPDIAGDTLHS